MSGNISIDDTRFWPASGAAGILVCPQCHGPLSARSDPARLDCAACRLRFRISQGIAHMLLEDAEVIG